MITIKYEEYHNDYYRSNKSKSFYNLSEFKNWFFGCCKGKYEDRISIPNPDSNIWSDGPSCLEVNCVWEEGFTYWVHEISKDGGIIYSDGNYTNRQKHWNEETKQMCRDMLERKKKPIFNFV